MKGKHIAVAASIFLIALIIVAGRLFLVRSISVVFEREPVFADEKTVIASSGLELYENIFNVNEKEVKANIEESYPNNAIAITNIERVFPNKIIIRAKERTALLVVQTDSGTYIPTDKDFQLTGKVESPDFNTLIKVTGVTAGKSFNRAEFRLVKEIMDSFMLLDFAEEAIVSFVKEIKVSENFVTVYTRMGEGAFVLGKENIGEKLQEAYSDFLTLLEEGDAIAFTVTKL